MKTLLRKLLLFCSIFTVFIIDSSYAEIRNDSNTENRKKTGEWHSGIAKDESDKRYSYISSEVSDGISDGLLENTTMGYVSVEFHPDDQCRAKPTLDLLIHEQDANTIGLNTSEGKFVVHDNINQLKISFNSRKNNEDLEIVLGTLASQKKIDGGRHYASVPLNPIAKEADYLVGRIVSDSMMVATFNIIDSRSIAPAIKLKYSLKGTSASFDRATSICRQMLEGQDISQKQNKGWHVSISPECARNIQVYRDNVCDGYNYGSRLCRGISLTIYGNCSRFVSRKYIQ